jgi:hypothetical protein
MLLQDGWSTFLLFFACSESIGSSGFLEDKGVAVLECESCAITKFGYPNDEGRPEHPLYALGLADASSPILEVAGSVWASEVAAQARASSERIWGGRGMKLPVQHRAPGRHFIVLLKEQTFECIAAALTVRLYAKDFAEAHSYVQQRFAEH